jgi:hypothetical protein
MNRFVFFFLTSSFAPLVACSSSSASPPAWVVNGGSTLSFAPSQVSASRIPSTCGEMSPPYLPADVLELSAEGSTAQKPYTDLFFAIEASATVGSAYTLQVMPVVYAPGAPTNNRQQAGNTPDNAVSFSFNWGADASEIDPNTLVTATATVEALPSKDGAPLTVRCVLTFSDSKVLDETFSGPTLSTYSGCPAG